VHNEGNNAHRIRIGYPVWTSSGNNLIMDCFLLVATCTVGRYLIKCLDIFMGASGELQLPAAHLLLTKRTLKQLLTG